MANISRRWLYLFLWSMILFLVASACDSGDSESEPTEVPTPDTIVDLIASGSGGTSNILSAIAQAFEADTPGYTLEVLSGSGTGGGVRGVMDLTLDVAAMGRPPKTDETDQGLEYTEFGRAGQAIFVHPDVDVDDLAAEQAAAIFAGEITNWSEVGGSDLEIVLFVRDEADSSTVALRESVFGDTPFPEQTVQVLTSQGDMQAAVEGTPGAVGFGTWPGVLAAGANIKAAMLDGVAPGDSAYPIFTTLGIGYLADRQEDVQPLIDWLLSDKGRAALQEFDVITDES